MTNDCFDENRRFRADILKIDDNTTSTMQRHTKSPKIVKHLQDLDLMETICQSPQQTRFIGGVLLGYGNDKPITWQSNKHQK